MNVTFRHFVENLEQIDIKKNLNKIFRITILVTLPFLLYIYFQFPQFPIFCLLSKIMSYINVCTVYSDHVHTRYIVIFVLFSIPFYMLHDEWKSENILFFIAVGRLQKNNSRKERRNKLFHIRDDKKLHEESCSGKSSWSHQGMLKIFNSITFSQNLSSPEIKIKGKQIFPCWFL